MPQPHGEAEPPASELMWNSRSAVVVLLFALVVSADVHAGTLSIGTWNLDGAKGLQDRHVKIQELGNFMRDVDFLILQETVGKPQIKAFLNASGHSTWNYAVSDFTDDTRRNPYHKLEVSIVSPHPMTTVYEADPYSRDDSASGKREDHDIIVPDYIPADQRRKRGSRGWLWVEFAELRIVVVALHLKSSIGRTGRSDEENSFKREAIVAALIDAIVTHEKQTTGWSYVVAGDFNVAPADVVKIGPDLNLRCHEEQCTGYDQTHALLGAGLVRGFAMRNLVLGLGSSYAKGSFAKSPIDNIYVRGPWFDRTETVLSERGETFGSDHHAIRVSVFSD